MKQKPRARASAAEARVVPVETERFEVLLANLRGTIREARLQVLRAVDTLQVRTSWLVGRHILEFEQGGSARAAYGKALLSQLAGHLTAEFGQGFDASNLYKMRHFYQTFPNLDALRLELSWTHYRQLLRVENDSARAWYMNEAADENWSTRSLDRQIGTLHYERLLASKDRQAVKAESTAKLAPLSCSMQSKATPHADSKR